MRRVLGDESRLEKYLADVQLEGGLVKYKKNRWLFSGSKPELCARILRDPSHGPGKQTLPSQQIGGYINGLTINLFLFFIYFGLCPARACIFVVWPLCFISLHTKDLVGLWYPVLGFPISPN